MMKKSYFSLFLLTAALLLTGCAADKSAGPELRTYASVSYTHLGAVKKL